MDSKLDQVQQHIGTARSNSVSTSDSLDAAASTSIETAKVVMATVLLVDAGVVCHYETNSRDLLDNAFDIITEGLRAKHLPLDNFIWKVDLAKTLISSLVDRNIVDPQNVELLRNLEKLSDVLSSTLTFNEGAEAALRDAELRDAIWKSQSTLGDLLQLYPRWQDAARPISPGQREMMRQLNREALRTRRAAGLQREIAGHVHTITTQLNKIKMYVREPIFSSTRID